MREPPRTRAGAAFLAVLLPAPLPEDGENPLAWIDDEEITNDESGDGS